MYKIGMSTSSSLWPDEQTFQNYAKSGIDYMEVCVRKDDYKDLDYKSVFNLSKKYGVGLWSFHLPFGPFAAVDPSSVELDIRNHTVSYYAELIKRAGEIGIDKFVIHPSGEPIADDIRAERMLGAKESLCELGEIAHKNGGVLCVENLPRTCLGKNSAEMKELLSANDKLRVCFDTNHLLDQDSTEFIKDLGDKIVTLHVSDYDFMNERHWLPGEGKIDWQKLIATLKEVNYKGVWMYEIGAECPKTIYRDRDLVCEDFAQNAKELFENKPITVFSTPKENLGMWQ